MNDTESRLRPVPDWSSETTLIPYSGLQILDFGFDFDAVNMRPRRFIERTAQREGEEEARELLPLSDDERRDEPILEASRPDDDEYAVSAQRAIDPFLQKWVPAPVLRIRQGRGADRSEYYDDGPFGWARLRVVDLGGKDPATGHTHRVQLAFDTTLAKDHPGGRYLSPEPKDSEDERQFRFVSDPDHVTPFLTFQRRVDADGTMVDTQAWVAEWLEEVFHEYMQARRGGRPLTEEDFEYRFEHLAHYMALLALVDRAVKVPRFRLVDVVSRHARHAPFDVDLVLDVGNSRTCGILIESAAGQTTVELSNSYGLEVRDLSRPEMFSTGLIESRVEFAVAEFGREHVARRSGRRDAFQWPGIVRTGPEAARMVRRESGTETASGLSSPKRYLWDIEPSMSEWRFQNHFDPHNMPRVARSACRFLNDEGDVIAQLRREIASKLRDRKEEKTRTAMATRPRFSRSSLYGFLVGELVCHALVQINDPASRARRVGSDVPRRLRSVILTLPSATPMQEQAIIRSRAEGAVRLIWSILDMDEDAATTCVMPKVIVDWDEASCTQLLYLYSEIAMKFEGRIDEYMALKGKPRAREAGGIPEDSLRIACVDIGGGTTDLMVTTFFGERNKLILPQQVFREGFRIAGDDVVRDVVGSIVLARVADSIAAAGGASVRERLPELFGGDVAGMDQRKRQMRRQFVVRVLAPLAVAALNACERIEEFDDFEISAAEVLGIREGEEEGTVELAVPDALLAYLELPAADTGADGWRLADFSFRVRRAEVDACVRNVLQTALRDMGEAIDYLDADVVLLTGRPSRLPAIRAMVREMMLVPSDRLISMHRYRAGAWYPFRDPVTSEVGDPKTTVATGGMLCALSSSRIANFRLKTEALHMRSTARFVGVMANDGQIRDGEVLFSEADQLSKRAQQDDEEATLLLDNPVHIGFRQLPHERWTTTPLYRLDFANESVLRRPRPLRVTLRRRDSSAANPENPEHQLRIEAAKEAFVVTEVMDDSDFRCHPEDVRLRLHTLGFEDAYWLDTGVCWLDRG